MLQSSTLLKTLSSWPVFTFPAAKRGEDSVTIGEALEAAGHARHDKPIDSSDASAIQVNAQPTRNVQLKGTFHEDLERNLTVNNDYRG